MQGSFFHTMTIRSALFILYISLSGCNTWSAPAIPNLGPAYRFIDTHNSAYGSVSVVDSLLIYCTTGGPRVFIKNIITGSEIYSCPAGEEYHTTPILKGSRLFVQTSPGVVSCIDIITKRNLWSYETEARNWQLNLAADTILIASVKDHGLVAINANTGKLIYKLEHDKSTNLPAGFLCNIAADDKHLYVAEWERSPLATFDLFTGEELWHIESQALYITSKPILAGCYVFIGLSCLSNANCEQEQSGKYMLINRTDGKIALQKESAPVNYITPPYAANTIYFTTYASDSATPGHLLSLNIKTFKTDTLCTYPKDEQIDDHIFLADTTLFFTKTHSTLSTLSLNTHTTTSCKAVFFLNYVAKYKGITYIVY